MKVSMNGFRRKVDGDFYDKQELVNAILPTTPNPNYQYLCRIITAVQSALRSTAVCAAITKQN